MYIKIYNIDRAKCKNYYDYIFIGLDTLGKYGLKVQREHYSCVYVGEMPEYNGMNDQQICNDLFNRLNVGRRPDGFDGHSLSVSDVIEIDGRYYYVDNYDFVRLRWF